ncbi:MAG: dihydroneopterin aldolase [Bacteroidales bacterium]|nr:dihydroneopterin aldolase [Bacteroidales bacterium]
MSLISLEGMEFFAYHGCYHEEQLTGTKFIVDLYFEADLSKSEASDKLSDTINYQEVYCIVKKEMETKSFLIEHIGRRILTSVKEHFPKILKTKIKVSKMNPQLGGKINNVSVTL